MSGPTAPPPDRPVAEDELHAYLDGFLADPARRAAVERHLRRDAEAARLAASYAAQREGLRRAFAAKAAEPVPARLDPHRLRREVAPRPRARGLALAASVAAALAVGSAAGWTARGLLGGGGAAARGVAAVSAEAAAAHRVFAPDRRQPVELDASRRDEFARWLEERFGRAVAIPDLAPSGYRLLGGRMVAAERGPAALLVYEDGRGARLTLYARPMADPGETAPMSYAGRGALGAWAWADRGLGYALSAEAVPRAALKRTADAVRDELGRGA